MNNRVKVFGIIGAVFVAATVLTYLASTSLIQSQYGKIEDQDTQKNTARAIDALNNRVDQLNTKIPDWASWDDTYAFIENHNQAYIESNIQASALQNLSISFMLFFNEKQELVYSKGVDLESGDDLPLPPELTNAFKPGSPLLAYNESSSHKGFIGTSGTPIFLASKPILTTDGTGPVHGTLVFAEYLTKTEVTKLADLTHLSLAYFRLSDGSLPSDVKSLLPSLTTKSSKIQRLSPQTIAGYQLEPDIYGNPLLAARVELPRDLFQEANRALYFYIVIIMFVTLAAILISLYTTGQINQRDRTIQLKNEFFSIASHELRTPLAAIRGNSELIRQHYGPKNDHQLTEIADDIHEAAVRLIKLVSNFLDAARLEQRSLPLTLAPMMVGEPITTVVKELKAMAAEKGLKIEARLSVNLPKVLGDPERVQQIIYNLVGNAMKFTDNGGVTISAQVQGDMVVILVADTGRGISLEGQKMLFSKFQQAKVEDATVGAGLGLFISKMLIEKMNGRIWIESSVEGEGTTLSFSLPIAPEG